MTNRYVNMKESPKEIQKKHGTFVAAMVCRLKGMSLSQALKELVYVK